MNVIKNKLTKLSTKTQVGIIWSFSRLNLQGDENVLELFDEIRELLKPQLSKLSEKSLAMILWSYSKVESPDQEFLEKAKNCISNINRPIYDHFDLTLIVQACKLFEGSHLIEDHNFMASTMAMLNYLESHIINHVEKMNVHQFITVSTFFLLRNIGSTKVINVFKSQITKHIEEFDRIQLALIRDALQRNTQGDHEYLVKIVEDKIEEINQAEADSLEDEKIEEMARKIIKMKLEKIMRERQRKKEADKKIGATDIRRRINRTSNMSGKFYKKYYL